MAISDMETPQQLPPGLRYSVQQDRGFISFSVPQTSLLQNSVSYVDNCRIYDIQKPGENLLSS